MGFELGFGEGLRAFEDNGEAAEEGGFGAVGFDEIEQQGVDAQVIPAGADVTRDDDGDLVPGEGGLGADAGEGRGGDEAAEVLGERVVCVAGFDEHGVWRVPAFLLLGLRNVGLGRGVAQRAGRSRFRQGRARFALRFRRREGGGGEADEGGQPGGVFPLVREDEEAGLGAGVGRGLGGGADMGAAGFGGFDVELVVRDEGDQLFAVVEGVFAEHGACGDVAGFGHLFQGERYSGSG